MKVKLFRWALLVLICLYSVPAFAAGEWETEINMTTERVWFWKDKQFAVVNNGGNNEIYVKTGGGEWKSELKLDDSILYYWGMKVLSIDMTKDEIYMVVDYGDEIKVYSSTNGTSWRTVVVNIPDYQDSAWLTLLHPDQVLVNTDKGFMMRYDKGVANWDLQVTSSCAPWENIVYTGDKVFAVIDNKLQFSTNLRNWQDTDYRVNKLLIDVFKKTEVGGKAVPSNDYATDETIVAFNPGIPGSVAISNDKGVNWEILDKELFKINKARTPQTITAAAVTGDVIALGTLEKHVLFSKDNGQSWLATEVAGAVLDLAIKDNLVLAATTGGLQSLDWNTLVFKEVPAEPEQDEETGSPGDSLEQDEQDVDEQDVDENNSQQKESERIIFTLGQSKYTVNDKIFEIDVAPLTREGRVYLPVRYLAISLGVPEENIGWEHPNVTLTKGDVTVTLNINTDFINVNGQIRHANQPLVINGRTFLPARWIAEAFGYTVDWDPQTNAIYITSS